MKSQVSNSKGELAEIKQNKYQSMFDFWEEVSKMLLELGCGNTHSFILTPITYVHNSVPYRVYCKIWVDGYKDVELGIYAVYDGIDIDTGWLRWMHIPQTYKEYTFKNTDKIEHIAKLMYENWEEYQPKFEVAIKEMVTEHLAQQLRKTEEEFTNVRNDIESEKSE